MNTRWGRVSGSGDKPGYDVPASQMEERSGRKIPASPNSLKYNEVVKLDLAMLYVDLVGFTKLVEGKEAKTVARIMTIYVTEMAAAVRHHGGTILDIQGDGMLAAFSDSSEEKNNAATTAVRVPITMHTLLRFVVNKRLRQFQQADLQCRYGIDHGRVVVTRAGLRGAEKNDLVYIGTATNYAVKFQALAKAEELVISDRVYGQLDDHNRNSDKGWQWSSSQNREYGTLYRMKASQWSKTEEPS